MHPGVQAAFSASGGLITRVQALDLGVSPSDIRALLRSGEWVVVRRGVYADGTVWAELDEWRGRPLLRAKAATFGMRRGWVYSHDSSAHQQGMDILAPDVPYVHVTRPGITNAWTENGIKYHLARFRPDQVVDAGGVRCLDLARTAVDIARERDLNHGVSAFDSAMRMGVPRRAFWDAAETMRSWPHVTRVRTGIELADPGAQTVAESLGRLLVHELGIGIPSTQFPMYISTGIAWCDVIVGRHVFEVDGRIKYRSVEDGGVSRKPVDQVVLEEKRRQREIAAEGLGVSRILWEDYWGRERVEARTRLRAEYEVTVDRFGLHLPEHLLRNAAEIRSRFGA